MKALNAGNGYALVMALMFRIGMMVGAVAVKGLRWE